MELFTAASLHGLVMATIYSILGVAVFFLAFVVVDRLTPGDMWREIIENKNSAVAIFFGACAIALAIVIAAAIHGG